MSINLEQIEALRERANVSYAEAKEALEMCNGDLVEALIYLEKSNKVKSEKCNVNSVGIWEMIKKLVRKGNSTRFVIKKNEREVLSMPVTVAVIAAIVATPLVVIGLVLAIVTSHRFRFESKNGEGMEINKTLDKVSEVVDSAKQKIVETEPVNQ
jgi:DNA-binding Lrp family transcriptional regulator